MTAETPAVVLRVAAEAPAHESVMDGSAVATSEETAHAPVADGSQKARWLRYGLPSSAALECLLPLNAGCLLLLNPGAAVAGPECLLLLDAASRSGDRGPRHRQAIRRGRLREPLNESLNSS